MMPLDQPSVYTEYGYPMEISHKLDTIIATIQKNNPKVINVLLIGSTARGEFSYRIESDSQVSLWSDFEFLVVSEKEPNPDDRKKLSDLLQSLELDWGKDSPLFHIDCSYISRKTLHHLPLWIRNYESKQIGKVILGQDIRSELPEINCDNLDYRELAEVILWRLWAMLLYAPKEWLFPKENVNQKTEELFSFVLCRNALDLTTYLLPWEKVLLPSFKERVTYINEHYAELQLKQYFDTAFPEYLNSCLRGKFEFIFPSSPQQLYQQTISYFIQAGKHLLVVNHENDTNTEITKALVKHQSQLFNEFRLRRKVYELILIKRYLSEKPISGWWAWYWQGKIGKMIVCLYHLHFALQAIVVTNKPEEAETELNIAADLLSQLSLRKLPLPCTDATVALGDRWLVLRKGFARFLMDLYQSVGVKEDYLNKILEKP